MLLLRRNSQEPCWKYIGSTGDETYELETATNRMKFKPSLMQIGREVTILFRFKNTKKKKKKVGFYSR
jgi:hypothetical protein